MLETAVSQGHRWWLRSEDISEEDCVMISEYRNADQNTNQVPLIMLDCCRLVVMYVCCVEV